MASNNDLTPQLQQILALVENLSPQEMYLLQREIAPARIDSEEDTIENIRFDNGRVCPYCGCVHIVRNGHRKKDNVQRYVCKDCGKSFVKASNSILEHTHKDINTWETYIKCMLRALSIRECAEECNINIKTSFYWRHKILDALAEMQTNVKLSGIVEADETFFEKSFKGIKQENKETIMGRKAHKRGTDSSYHKEIIEDEEIWVKDEKKKRGLSKDKVCVPCAINRNGLYVAKVAKEGKVSLEALEKVFGNKIKPNTVMCTDKEKSYRIFTEDRDIKLVQLKEKETKNGIYHINGVNNYHSRFKKFLYPMNGVATKYLNNYIVWFNYLSNTKGNKKYKEKALFTYLLKLPFAEDTTKIDDRPALPFVC